jgi:hypothetical protein
MGQANGGPQSLLLHCAKHTRCSAVVVAAAAAVLEWVKANGGPQSFSPAEDPGVVACRRMYAYFRKHGHDTICMPASWRSSTGNDLLDEVRCVVVTLVLQAVLSCKSCWLHG